MQGVARIAEALQAHMWPGATQKVALASPAAGHGHYHAQHAAVSQPPPAKPVVASGADDDDADLLAWGDRPPADDDAPRRPSTNGAASGQRTDSGASWLQGGHKGDGLDLSDDDEGADGGDEVEAFDKLLAELQGARVNAGGVACR